MTGDQGKWRITVRYDPDDQEVDPERDALMDADWVEPGPDTCTACDSPDLAWRHELLSDDRRGQPGSWVASPVWSLCRRCHQLAVDGDVRGLARRLWIPEHQVELARMLIRSTFEAI